MEVKVKALRDFHDRENNMQLRKAGSEFEVDQKRADLLAGRKLVEILRDPEKPKAKPAAASTKTEKK